MFRSLQRSSPATGARSSRSSVVRRVSLLTGNQPAVGSQYQGKYGPWTLTNDDIQEVANYRGSVSVAAALLTLISVPHALGLPALPAPVEDLVAVAGAGTFLASTFLIHIYFAPIKRAIQALAGLGLLGTIILSAVALPEGISVVDHVYKNPWDMMLVGPTFAALTGVAFKENLCYGRQDPKFLMPLAPLMCLAHMIGGITGNALEPGSTLDSVDRVLVLLFTFVAARFAFNKWPQAVTDDLGDKSVFEFLDLTEAQQQQRLRELGLNE